jgi:hypothetical protein
MQDIIEKKVERSTSTRKNIRWNNELLAQVDEARGDESFSSWVQSACRDKLSKAK